MVLFKMNIGSQDNPCRQGLYFLSGGLGKIVKERYEMDLERLKKTLAKLGIASLIAGSALSFTGCHSSTGNSS
jgi:radical SAM modification target selenobiotic family peptide